MPDSEPKSTRKWWVTFALVVTTVVVITFYIRVTLPTRGTRAVVDAYHTLEIGASRDFLTSHFPRAPDLVCEFTSAKILYYHADPRAHYIPGFGDTQKQRISDLKKEGSVPADNPPFLYGYVQVLVDTKSNRVTSKSWMGEDAYTYTSHGDFRYATLAELPEDVQTSLHLNRGEIGHVE